MKKKRSGLTTAQFAKLHGVNKRTLHYYDTIGLFSLRKKEKMDIAIMILRKVWNLSIFGC